MPLLRGGGRAAPLAAGCAVSTGGGAGSGRHLAAAGDFTASAVILLDLALVRLSFSEANRIHSTSLAEAKGFNVELLAHVIWDTYQSLGWKVWW